MYFLKFTLTVFWNAHIVLTINDADSFKRVLRHLPQNSHQRFYFLVL